MRKEVARRRKEQGQEEKKVACWDNFLLGEKMKSALESFWMLGDGTLFGEMGKNSDEGQQGLRKRRFRSPCRYFRFPYEGRASGERGDKHRATENDTGSGPTAS